MNRLLATAALVPLLAALPAHATTRTAQAERAALARIASPATAPIRAALRPTTLRTATPRRTRYELSRMMARNFGTIGQRDLDLLVASVQ